MFSTFAPAFVPVPPYYRWVQPYPQPIIQSRSFDRGFPCPADAPADASSKTYDIPSFRFRHLLPHCPTDALCKSNFLHSTPLSPILPQPSETSETVKTETSEKVKTDSIAKHLDFQNNDEGWFLKPSCNSGYALYFNLDLNDWRNQGIQFIEKMHLASIENVKSIRIFVNNDTNALWIMKSPFITKDIDFKFPVAGHDIFQLRLVLTFDDLLAAENVQNYKISFDFNYRICDFSEKIYVQGSLKKTSRPDVYTFPLHTVFGKISQIKLDLRFKIEDIYMDYEGKGEYDKDKAKKSFLNDHWSFPEPNRCLLNYTEPMNYSKLEHPQLIIQLAENESINDVNETIFLELTRINGLFIHNGQVKPSCT